MNIADVTALFAAGAGVLTGLVTFGIAWGTFNSRLKKVEDDVKQLTDEFKELAHRTADELAQLRAVVSDIDKSVSVTLALLQGRVSTPKPGSQKKVGK